MNRESTEEIALSFGIIAVAVGLLLVLGALSPEFMDSISPITGRATVQTTVNIVPTPPSNCNTTFIQGWNLISLYCISNNLNISTVLSPISGSYTKVFAYQAGSSDPWKAYTSESLPAGTVVDLSSMRREAGYWIYVTSDVVYFYSGNKKLNNTVSLPFAGWNLVGYPTNISRAVNQSFPPSSPNVTRVRAYNASIPTTLYYPPNSSTDASNTSLRTLVPYWGYWIYVNQTGDWIVDW